MKTLILALAISMGLTGCVAYPVERTVTYSDSYGGEQVVYEGSNYYYNPAYITAGFVGLYYFDNRGYRHWHYVPRSHWNGPHYAPHSSIRTHH